jgi:hypothetical protein
VGETLAETRVEVEALRTDLQQRANALEARVRHALDIPARIRENPVVFIGIGLGTAFLVAGGPMRVARLVRRRLRPSSAEQAYDALPKAMQAWVDTVASGIGPRAAGARNAMAEELLSWRHNAVKSKKARRELAKSITEGPPGPERAIWRAVESGLTLLSAAMARRAIERFINGPPGGAGVTSTPSSSTKPANGNGGGPHVETGPGPREYSGFATVARPQASADG